MKFSRFPHILICCLLFTNCYINPIFRQKVDDALAKSKNGLQSILALIAISNAFLSGPSGAKAEIKFSKADGSVYGNQVVAIGEEKISSNIRKQTKTLSNIFYTDSSGKVTIYFSKLDTTYAIEIRDHSGTTYARIKIMVPKNLSSNLDLVPVVEFGDVVTTVISVSPIGGSIPASLSYAGSPYIFTKDVTIPQILPTYSGFISDCKATPNLPSGLILGNTDCGLTGTPTSLSPVKTYTITASNSNGNTSNEIIISVTENPPANIVYVNSPFLFTTSLPIVSQTPTYTGSIASCSISPALPIGLSLDTTTCTISGTPSVISVTTNYTVTGTNSNGTATVIISITVNDIPPSALNYTGNPFTFTQGLAISTVTPTFSGSVSSCISAPGLPSGLIINATTCEITGTPTNIQGITNYTITAANAFGNTSSSIQIGVNIAPPSSLIYAGTPYIFTQGIAIANQTPTFSGTIVSCSASPALPTGLGINPSTCVISGTPTIIQASASYTITASNASGSTQVNIDITINISPPTSLSYTGNPFTFTQNTTISSLSPTFSGSVTSCISVPGLPSGLGINPTNCSITGTPSIPQALTSYTITASNSSGNTNATIDIVVNNEAPTGLSYAGNPFIFTRTISIGTLTPSLTGTITNCLSAPALPSGLIINATTCAITGIPTLSQMITAYTITASNVSGNTNANINITIVNPNCQADSGTLDSCILP
jgi:hypothetical protein